nr:ABC transporter G family member 6 [Ipomoea batatas]
MGVASLLFAAFCHVRLKSTKHFVPSGLLSSSWMRSNANSVRFSLSGIGCPKSAKNSERFSGGPPYTVCPWERMMRRTLTTKNALVESSPEVGSSRKRMIGSWIMSIPIETRRRSPPETPRWPSSPITVFAALCSPNWSIRAWTLIFFFDFDSVRGSRNSAANINVSSTAVLRNPIRQGINERGFPAPGRAENGEDFAVASLSGDIIEEHFRLRERALPVEQPAVAGAPVFAATETHRERQFAAVFDGVSEVVEGEIEGEGAGLLDGITDVENMVDRRIILVARLIHNRFLSSRISRHC